ncbi:14949_t:CDS:2 [Dentiscutata heterogama]|uniref:14949_t:CDS:1 n=1 Tax=Dentiscutata heterogama TaxID=1316150 RepID=A0ACA9LFY1_9GLOM|nr:14949_t:CDS:2 [Dentiscutata heterogama]
MSSELVITPEKETTMPAESIVDGNDLSNTAQEDFLSTTVDKIKQEQDDILETPPSPGSLQNPPPPYSQWDELSLEQLLEKGKELIGHTEYLANGGGEQKEQKDGKVLDKMTQLESLVSSLQHILNDQTFAMHDLRSQLSDIQIVLKKMQDKQETITNEEVMKQVATMKALTENILTSNERNNLVPITPSSEILNASPTTVQTTPSSRQTSRVPSRAPSRAPSRVPSRTTSRAPSRAPSSSRPVSRAVSPAHTPSLSRSSSRYKLDLPTSEHKNDIPKIEEGSDEDEELEINDPSFNKMRDLLNFMINEAQEAVEKPVKGRDKKKRAPSTTSRGLKREKAHKRQKSVHEERFELGMMEFNKSIADFNDLVDAMTTDNVQEEEYDPCIQYVDSTRTLIGSPSENLADLDDFSQQCRLLTRALILPFLHATHSFMCESLKTTNTNSPRSMTSTTRTFMNLMYWTFLFTLGSLVLDAWLCEVAGRQVIRMQDGGFGVLGDGKKKNVKFRTGPKMKAVTWKGVETGVVGSGKRWLRDGMMNLRRKSRRLLTSGRWNRWEIFSRTTVGRFEEECSDDSEEWEIVDFDSSDGEDSETEEDEIEEDPAIVLRRRITNERSRRAGHVNSMIIDKDYAKKEIINDLIETDVSTDQSSDSQEKLDPLLEKMTDITFSESLEDVDLNIPGSFPSQFRWTPPPSPIVDVIEVAENVRRVTSVVLRRPKRNGPFGGSGSFWIMKTHKIKTRSITSKDVTSAVLKSSSSKSSPISKKKSSKSLPKRTWIRRNSI